MKSDIEIARETPLKSIAEIAEALGIAAEHLHPYGHHMAKVKSSTASPDLKGKLILVTSMSPTKTGNGKTVTTVSIALGLHALGKQCTVVLREPSMGPVFGMKGGAAGGGHAQVLPMEDINLHFTGDFHAVTSAHNTIAALLENYQYRNRNSDKALKELTWKRVLDVNDRALRNIVTGLGGSANGTPNESGFDITAASEIMAILCLARDANDLRNRIDNITLGYTMDGNLFSVKDLGIGGAIAMMLKDALFPNLVQTTEHTPAFIHGGPFANIAHGCNSLAATLMALQCSDFAVTEAGFGADLGAEKFFNIKCRASGLEPALTVIVVTLQALKVHGGKPEADAKSADLDALESGILNLSRHIENISAFGQQVVVALNRFPFDTEAEIRYVSEWCKESEVPFAIHSGHATGGEGATVLANVILNTLQYQPSDPLKFSYDTEQGIEHAVRTIAERIYRAGDVQFSDKAKLALKRSIRQGWNSLPVCIAKTQYSFSDDPSRYGAPEGHILHVRDIVPNTGAGFAVVIAGEIMRMPGLPALPAAMGMDIQNGEIHGLS